jgi:hypothetical protein
MYHFFHRGRSLESSDNKKQLNEQDIGMGETACFKKIFLYLLQ